MSNMRFIFFCAKPVVKLLLGIIKNSLVVMVLIYSIYLYVVNLIDLFTTDTGFETKNNKTKVTGAATECAL